MSEGWICPQCRASVAPSEKTCPKCEKAEAAPKPRIPFGQWEPSPYKGDPWPKPHKVWYGVGGSGTAGVPHWLTDL